jgi:hypothetical protein
MASMPIVYLALKIDNFKIEQVFQLGYHEGGKVFYVFPMNWQGVEENC